MSRQATLKGLDCGGDSAMPFVPQFHGSASVLVGKMKKESCTRLCKHREENKVTLSCRLSLGQHPASTPGRAGPVARWRTSFASWMTCTSCAHLHGSTLFVILQHVFTHSSIRVHHGKTQVWNRGSVAPLGIEVLQAVARVNDPDAILWRGDPTLRVRILGTPLGHPDFVRSQLSMSETHDQLLEKVLTIQDLQCAWLLLLYCCGSGKLHPQSGPELTAEFRSPPRFTPEMPQPPSRGCSCQHSLGSGQFATVSGRPWAPQCNIARKTHFLGKLGRLIEMIHQRHPTVCARIVDALHAQHPSFHLDGVREDLASAGFHRPFLAGDGGWCSSRSVAWCRHGTWHPRNGWQRTATEPVHSLLIDGTVRPRLSGTEKALFRLRGGPLAGIPFLCFPTSRSVQDGFLLFRVLLLRRWLPLPPSSRFCRCGEWPPPCSLRASRGAGLSRGKRRAGVSGSRCTCVHKCAREGLALVAARRCLSAGGRRRRSSALPWSTDRSGHHFGVFSETQRHPDSRRAWEHGAALRQAGRRKERVYPELSGAWQSQTCCSRK